VSNSTLHDRLAIAAGSRTYKQLSDLTGTHPETVRRYMLGQSPSVDFLASLCNGMEINASWLLTGRGPMRVEDLRTETLSQADPSELLNAVADTMNDLLDRVDRLERYCQTMETRLRVSAQPGPPTAHAPSVSASTQPTPDPLRGGTDFPDRPDTNPTVQTPGRAKRISDAIGD
jgi:transcriptional regulator with XRE-family HTH domain